MTDHVLQFTWGHVNVNVCNLERSIALYEKLGFESYRPGIPYLDLTDGAGTAEISDSCAHALGLAVETRARGECLCEPRYLLVSSGAHPKKSDYGTFLFRLLPTEFISWALCLIGISSR